MEEIKQEQLQLPNEVYLNVVGGDTPETTQHELSTEKRDDNSVSYIRADVFDNLFTEAQKLMAEEIKDSTEMCTKSLDLMSMNCRIQMTRTYGVAMLLFISAVLLSGVYLFCAVLFISLINLLVGIRLDRENRKKFDAIVTESKLRRDKRNEQGEQNS